ncbi:WbqC family protein [Sphingobacterium psychroaquaticum]|uniref:WbqC-like protein family protein n=1 Tax=Sphingobacterium psychroaquaticum TaxID=561061 RepID=A0A1X7IGB6_9SPHI|nr:WbqC family protein [Sphingobacterium psychroaquaticum]QBQ41584.1 hypothetical protein E2P86_10665 [Sphingobacterium psychroaquaticum]SMG13566.1 WbqC-like protein family protein [Sphingobacterium psychroaquaticum]
MESKLLLPAFYLPPISYFHTIKEHALPLLVEKHENYPKQTYRTRARIATANGVLELFVPVLHGRKEHGPIKDTRINYDHDWQRLHWLSLQAAYRSSAYFEYYEDDFVKFYNQKHNFLLDFNMEQLELFLKCFKLKRTLEFTGSYYTADDVIDLRNSVHPKKGNAWPDQKPYYQVFEEKQGFIPDLSAVDLLFNQGPQSGSYL